MSASTRKLIGTIALLIMITVYALLAMAAALVLQVRGAGPVVEFLYYLLTGLLWVIPAGLIIKWMVVDPKPKNVPANN